MKVQSLDLSSITDFSIGRKRGGCCGVVLAAATCDDERSGRCYVMALLGNISFYHCDFVIRSVAF